MPGEIPSGFGATNCLEDLRPGGRGLGDDMQRGIAPVRRHLTAAGTWIIGGAYALQKHVVGLNPQRQAERAIAVIGIEPVVSRLESQSCGHSDRLVSGT